MSEEPKTDEQKRIEKMDKVADSLLDLIAKEGTSEAQKGRLFAQVQSWYKLRPALVPVEPGGRMKEMSDGVKSKGTKRSGSAGTGGSARVAKDGRAIQEIIRGLPKFGAGGNSSASTKVSRDDSDAGGDQEDPERSGGGAAGYGGSVSSDGDSNVPAVVDGARNLN